MEISGFMKNTDVGNMFFQILNLESERTSVNAYLNQQFQNGLLNICDPLYSFDYGDLNASMCPSYVAMDKDSMESKKMDGWIIAIIVIGSVVIIGLLIYLLYFKRNASHEKLGVDDDQDEKSKLNERIEITNNNHTVE